MTALKEPIRKLIQYASRKRILLKDKPAGFAPKVLLVQSVPGPTFLHVGSWKKKVTTVKQRYKTDWRLKEN
jgi:hypothetical protein